MLDPQVPVELRKLSALPTFAIGVDEPHSDTMPIVIAAFMKAAAVSGVKSMTMPLPSLAKMGTSRRAATQRLFPAGGSGKTFTARVPVYAYSSGDAIAIFFTPAVDP